MATARRRGTVLTAKIMAHKQRYGAYPESLDVFGEAEYTVDPFTERRMVYRREGDDFVLYSLGADGVDHGGIPYLHKRDGASDRVFWPRPRDDP
jgi:hypothetical protein